MNRRRPIPSRGCQRGLSIVELLVGVAVGLIVVAAATMLVASQLGDNRRILIETQLQQDLRAASDIMARELRRAGYWSAAESGIRLPGASAAPANPYASAAVGPDAADGQYVVFAVASPDRPDDATVDADERFGFRLRDGVLESQLGQDNWQPLTDPRAMRVTELHLRPQLERTALPCALSCAASAAGPCPPELVVRSVQIDLAGTATHDSAVRRTVGARVRLRNDLIDGSCR